MVKYGVLFEVRTEFLKIIYTRFGFKGLNLNSINQLIFVMVKYGVLFEVRTEFLNIVWNSSGLKELHETFSMLLHPATFNSGIAVHPILIQINVIHITICYRN
jgi:hypothetical protein